MKGKAQKIIHKEIGIPESNEDMPRKLVNNSFCTK
jgi:hypothetical protein